MVARKENTSNVKYDKFGSAVRVGQRGADISSIIENIESGLTTLAENWGKFTVDAQTQEEKSKQRRLITERKDRINTKAKEITPEVLLEHEQLNLMIDTAGSKNLRT